MGESVRSQSPTVALSCVDAIATGLRDGGLDVITNFPGFHSHDIFAAAGGSTTSVNEKTAYSVAWGAALTGKRAAVTFKNVGLNDAADAFLNSMLLGINGGFVAVVTDDIDMEGSQIRLDSRHYFAFYRGLWFDPVSIQHAYDAAFRSFALSERFHIPVVIRITNRLLRRWGTVRRKRPIQGRRIFMRDSGWFVVHPVNAEAQLAALKDTQVRIADYVESVYGGFQVAREAELKIVVGAPAVEDLDESATLSIYTYPLPESFLTGYLAGGGRISLHEHGDPIVGAEVERLASIREPRQIQADRPSERPVYHNHDFYEKLFSAVRSFEERIVCGDLGEYTMDPHRTIDACLCFGGSVGVGLGAALGNSNRRVFAITGDGAFLHSGKTALSEALVRGVRMTVIILDNAGSRTTGGQMIPGNLDEITGLSVFKSVDYESTDTDKFSRILREMSHASGVCVLRVTKN